jgi:hypothetical protein
VAFGEGLPDEKRISGVVFDKKHLGGVHRGTQDEESLENATPGETPEHVMCTGTENRQI